MLLNQQELFKLLVAALVGGIIGVEREWHNKSAGLRTISLLTIGSTLFTMLSIQSGDNRIVANIVVGVGFLGAGVILFSGGRIRGLTTASSVWVAAATGMAIGFGEFELALFVAGMVVVVLWLYTFVARYVEANARETITYDISYSRARKFERLEELFKKHRLYIRERKRFKRGRIFAGQWQVDGNLPQHQRFVAEALIDKEILDLHY
jgi:putative Mg2+ transporter-C (MgtC) family protein